MIVKYVKLHPDAKKPSYAHEGDACADIYSVANHTILPNKWAAIGTGLSVEIPEGYELQVRAKSGIALNHGVTILNGIGTIDCGYRGEIKAILVNLSNEPYEIKKGQKIAQIALSPTYTSQFVEMSLSESERGTGGFGSTGL